jgi:hypothetical protein
MTYSKKQILKLENEINKKVPLLAIPTSNLIKQLKKSGIQIKITEKLKIDKVAFSKKDFDIYCSFYLTEAKMAVFTSIVNLSFIDKGPLFEEIIQFQAWDGIVR